MRRKLLFIAACVLCVALTAGAQVIEEFQFFPVVARTAGAGDPPTRWVTDLTVHNVENSEVRVGVQFFSADRTESLDEPEQGSFTLGPRETRTFEDVLSDLFGYTTDVKGSLMLQGEDGEILATTRTYNVGSPEGTYGQTIPWNWLVANSFSTPSIVTGARNDSRFRSNLGIVNFSEEGVTMRYRVLNSSNDVLVEGGRDLDMFSMNQWSFNKLGVGNVDGPLTVEVRFDEDSASPVPCLEPPESNYFIAYVSKVDGNPTGTGDAEFIYAAPVDTCD
jgi:hypothetical protein